MSCTVLSGKDLERFGRAAATAATAAAPLTNLTSPKETWVCFSRESVDLPTN